MLAGLQAVEKGESETPTVKGAYAISLLYVAKYFVGNSIRVSVVPSIKSNDDENETEIELLNASIRSSAKADDSYDRSAQTAHADAGIHAASAHDSGSSARTADADTRGGPSSTLGLTHFRSRKWWHFANVSRHS